MGTINHRAFPTAASSRSGTRRLREQQGVAPLFPASDSHPAFGRLDLIARLAPVAPALRDPYYDWRPARAAFADLAAYDQAAVVALGVTRGAYGPPWQISYDAKRFWKALTGDVARIVRAEPLPDGGVREWIAADDAAAYWRAVRCAIFGDSSPSSAAQGWRPADADLPVWLAAMAACLPPGGPAWRCVAPDRLERTLPPWPLRRSDGVLRIEVREDVQHLVSVCVLPGRLAPDGKDTLLHLSAVGPSAKLRALWAAVLNRRREPLSIRIDGDWWNPRRADGRNQYVTHWNDQPLPASGLAHLALTHCSAFAPTFGAPFLHLVGNDLERLPDLPRFAQQLERAISLPFDPAWAVMLWQMGRMTAPGETDPLIVPLPSLGCGGSWVQADDARWLRRMVAIQRGCDLAAVTTADLAVSEIGVATPMVEVIEYEEVNGEDEDNEL